MTQFTGKSGDPESCAGALGWSEASLDGIPGVNQ